MTIGMTFFITEVGWRIPVLMTEVPAFHVPICCFEVVKSTGVHKMVRIKFTESSLAWHCRNVGGKSDFLRHDEDVSYTHSHDPKKNKGKRRTTEDLSSVYHGRAKLTALPILLKHTADATPMYPRHAAQEGHWGSTDNPWSTMMSLWWRKRNGLRYLLWVLLQHRRPGERPRSWGIPHRKRQSSRAVCCPLSCTDEILPELSPLIISDTLRRMEIYRFSVRITRVKK